MAEVWSYNVLHESVLFFLCVCYMQEVHFKTASSMACRFVQQIEQVHFSTYHNALLSTKDRCE